MGVAEDYGIAAAILYRDIQFWCEENEAKKQNIRDGCAWMYRSIAEFLKMYPYLSKHIIFSGLKTLEDAGLIRSGNYNRLNLDRTKWYTSQVEKFKPDCPDSGNGSPNRGNGLPDLKNGSLNLRNGDSDSGNGLPDSGKAFPQIEQPFSESGQPIPYLTTTLTETLTETLTTTPTTNSNSSSDGSSTGGGGRTTTRPPTTTPYTEVIRRKTTGFDLDQLQELVSMGASEAEIAIRLYGVSDNRPFPWSDVYENVKKDLTNRGRRGKDHGQ